MHLSRIVLLIAALIAQTLAAEITVQTRFSQQQVAMGNPVQYIVEITETSNSSRPELQSISSLPINDTGGLRLQNGRSSSNSSTQIMNGRVVHQVTRSAIMDVVAPGIGAYTIPAFQMVIDGTSYTAPAAQLQVVENTQGELVFIRTNIPETLYLGQTTAIELELFIANGVRSARIRDYDFTADGFEIPTQLPENERESRETFKNRSYQVISWPIEITPLSTGPQDVAFQFLLSAQMPNASSQGSSQRSPFGGSLFDDFFARTENFPVYSSQTVNVLPVPAAGKPESYTGAIGSFIMNVTTDVQESEVGEPIMLSVKLSGKGNFSRIQAPKLAPDSNWKVYEPEGQIEQPDQPNGVVSKRYDYVMVPRKAGELETPEVHFAYFDPSSKTYTELEGPSIPINVAPSSNRTLANTALTETQDKNFAVEELEPDLSRALTRAEALLTLDYQAREPNSVDSAKPFTSAWFIGINALLAIGTVACGMALKKRARLSSDPKYASLVAMRRDLKAAKTEAQGAKDADDFFRHANEALRLALGCKVTKDLRSAELPELEAQLEALSIAEDYRSEFRRFFEAGHKRRFSSKCAPVQLADVQKTFNHLLQGL